MKGTSAWHLITTSSSAFDIYPSSSLGAVWGQPAHSVCSGSGFWNQHMTDDHKQLPHPPLGRRESTDDDLAQTVFYNRRLKCETLVWSLSLSCLIRWPQTCSSGDPSAGVAVTDGDQHVGVGLWAAASQTLNTSPKTLWITAGEAVKCQYFLSLTSVQSSDASSVWRSRFHVTDVCVESAGSRLTHRRRFKHARHSTSSIENEGAILEPVLFQYTRVLRLLPDACWDSPPCYIRLCKVISYHVIVELLFVFMIN